MKSFLVLLIWLQSAIALSSTYGFKAVSIGGNTGLSGKVTFSARIPGTFDGLQPADPANGRYLQSATIWTDAPAAGDQLIKLQVVDNLGVVPVPARVAFPNYPVIFNLLDTVSGFTPALYIPSSGIKLEALDNDGNPKSRFIPSQLDIDAEFQAGGLGVGRVVRVVIRWGAWE